MVKIKKKVIKEVEIITDIECDKCHKVYCNTDNCTTDIFEIQEFHHINFFGGYGSIFGDGNHIECDLCQYCLKEIFGQYCKITEDNHL